MTNRVKEWTLGHSDIESLDEQRERLLKERREALREGSVVEGIAYKATLAGRSGMSFMLMPEPHHTNKDVSCAADRLRASRDVVDLYQVRIEAAAALMELETDRDQQAARKPLERSDGLDHVTGAALDRFVIDHGPRKWKEALWSCWMKAHYPGCSSGDSAALQRLRNNPERAENWFETYRSPVVAGAARLKKMDPARKEFVEVLAKETGSDLVAADEFTKSFELLAAKHFVLCLMGLDGLSREQETARDAIERDMQSLVKPLQGVKGLGILQDARGTTVGLKYESGVCNRSGDGGMYAAPLPEAFVQGLLDRERVWRPHSEAILSEDGPSP